MTTGTQKTKWLEKWVTQHPPIVALTSLQIALSADEVLYGMKLLRDNRDLSCLPGMPPIDDWLRLYRRHRDVSTMHGIALGVDGEEMKAVQGISDMMRGWSNPGRVGDRYRDQLRQELKALSWEEWGRINRIIIAEIADFIQANIDDVVADDPFEGVDNHTLDAQFGQPGILFHCFVWMPCWVAYREYPAVLMCKARHGDLGALENLLRVDKSVVRDRGIAQVIRDAAVSGNKAQLHSISRGLAGRPTNCVTPGKVKAALCSLISAMAVKLKHPLTEPQIRDLFDALAAIKGKRRDHDLPASSEALSKAIQRGRPDWPTFSRTKVPGGLSGS